jgi:hypothetical protein
MLLPGTVIPLTPADVLTGSPGVLLDSVVQPFVAANPIDYNGTLTAAVIRNAAGTLDFYYQIENDGSSLDTLSRNTNSPFASILQTYSTNVFYRTDDAGLGALFEAGDPGATPLAAARSGNARSVAFIFEPPPVVPPVVEGIDPGETSMILVIRTNATNYSGGFSAVINSTTTTERAFGPIGPVSIVPEPASLLLLSSAFGAAGYVARHRAKRKKPRSQ